MTTATFPFCLDGSYPPLMPYPLKQAAPSVQVTTGRQGLEQRRLLSTAAPYTFQLKWSDLGQSLNELQLLHSFWLARNGPYESFVFFDFDSARYWPLTQYGTGDGATTEFQLPYPVDGGAGLVLRRNGYTDPLTRTQYGTGDGVTTDFDIPLDAGTPTGEINLFRGGSSDGAAHTWANNGAFRQVRFTVAPAAAAVLEYERFTGTLGTGTFGRQKITWDVAPASSDVLTLEWTGQRFFMARFLAGDPFSSLRNDPNRFDLTLNLVECIGESPVA